MYRMERKKNDKTIKMTGKEKKSSAIREPIVTEAIGREREVYYIITMNGTVTITIIMRRSDYDNAPDSAPREDRAAKRHGR